MLIAAPLGQDPGYLVGWGTLSLINAGLAQGKNRSGLAWFLTARLWQCRARTGF
jgi:hypothetical protein